MGVAQLVERWLVVPDVAGSSPVIHPSSARHASRPVLTVEGVRVLTVEGVRAPAADPDTTRSTDTVIRPDVPWVTIVWNDPVNLMSYVTHVFRRYFGYPRAEAERLMLLVHHEGKAVVATGPREEMERHAEAMHEYGLWATVAKSDE